MRTNTYSSQTIPKNKEETHPDLFCEATSILLQKPDKKSYKKQNKNKKSMLMSHKFKLKILSKVLVGIIWGLAMADNWKKAFVCISFVCVYSCYSKDMLILFPGYFLNFWAHGTTIVIVRSKDKLTISLYFYFLIYPESHETHGFYPSISFEKYNWVFIPLVWFPPSFNNTSASYLTLPFNASLPPSLRSLCQVLFSPDILISLLLYHYISPRFYCLSLGSWIQNGLVLRI